MQAFLLAFRSKFFLKAVSTGKVWLVLAVAVPASIYTFERHPPYCCTAVCGGNQIRKRRHEREKLTVCSIFTCIDWDLWMIAEQPRGVTPEESRDIAEAVYQAELQKTLVEPSELCHPITAQLSCG